MRMWDEIFTRLAVIAPYETLPGSRSSAIHSLSPCANPVSFLNAYLIVYNYFNSSNSIREKVLFLQHVNMFYENIRSLRNLRLRFRSRLVLDTYL